MNYTHLGRTGLKVSRLCLGTMNFGDVTDEKTSARILDEALEAGINFIDTADVYGTEQSPDIQQGSGLSEEIIGRWLQQGGRRERIVLATKVYQPMGPGPNDRRLSAYHIRKACEDSLRRLKTDHIDVYQMHPPSDVALAWLLQNPVVTAPLIGPRTVEQLQQALHATTVTLSDDTMSCLDEIWPGPGGEAPQAYAW
ncbi:aldo/keto reductase [Klebsiella pneumoniae]|uniref:aldo/keto reductase n=1 Tax=Klebsiella pneumoniae TaxID=573 RepID=UPI0021E75F8A|nr:aldo/keto reductase [Klebsiella pneumoniae]